jgi:hypothetical protein
MDTSLLIQLNPTAKIVPTKKLFYDHYAYKIKIYAPASTSLRYEAVRDYDAYIKKMIFNEAQFSIIRGVKYSTKYEDLKNASPSQLANLKKLVDENKDIIKFRTEEPNFILYSNDVALLERVIAEYATHIIDVTLPNNENHLKLLNEGNVIKNEHNEFKYKFILGNFYNMKNKSQLMNIIKSAGDDVHLTDKTLKNISSGYSYGGYMYANDNGVAMLFNMIQPGFVKKIYNMVSLSE